MKMVSCINKSIKEDIKELNKFLKVIFDRNRLQILYMLCRGQKCVCQIWRCLNLPQNLVSHHLRVLKNFKLISSKKKGVKVFYKLNQKIVKKYSNLLNKFFNKEK
jgi:ArsR family transcriptional regulator